jgi:hypothetical protein
MEERHVPNWLVKVAMIGLLVGIVLLWLADGPVPSAFDALTAAPVPTLMPTPALVIVRPTPAPRPLPTAPPAVYVENNGGQVVINNNTTNVNVCISLDCN